MLAGLSACQAIVYRCWATKLDIAIDDVTVVARGELDVRGFFGIDDTVRPGFEKITYEVTVSGPESPSRYRALAAAVDSHCPVLDIVANPTPVESRLTIA